MKRKKEEKRKEKRQVRTRTLKKNLTGHVIQPRTVAILRFSDLN